MHGRGRGVLLGRHPGSTNLGTLVEWGKLGRGRIYPQGPAIRDQFESKSKPMLEFFACPGDIYGNGEFDAVAEKYYIEEPVSPQAVSMVAFNTGLAHWPQK